MHAAGATVRLSSARMAGALFRHLDKKALAVQNRPFHGMKHVACHISIHFKAGALFSNLYASDLA